MVATVIQMSVLLVLKQKAEEKVISMEMAKENTNSYNIKSQRLIKKIDNMSTFLFPLTFMLFNVVYWSVLCKY